MIMKNQELCRQCLFGWQSGGLNNKIYCEYQLVTDKRRENSERSCQSYKHYEQKRLTVKEKQAVYRELVRLGKI